jgi:hypothetical protein
MNQPSITKQELEIIGKNWEFFKKLAGKITRDSSNITAFLEFLEEDKTFLTSPASTRHEYTGCYHGGLLELSLKTIEKIILLKKHVYDKKNISNDSLLLVGLFSNIGKIGITHQEYYLPQISKWHREQGQLYTINPVLSHWNVGQLSLFNLSNHGISLTDEEWFTINALHSYKEEAVTTFLRESQPELLLISKQGTELAALELKNKLSTTSV